jgi:hypothetical protein
MPIMIVNFKTLILIMILFILVYIAAIISVTGYILIFGTRVLEVEDIVDFKANEVRNGENIYVEISGFSFNSFPHTYRFSTQKKDPEILVQIHEISTKRNPEGIFTYVVKIDKDVDRITFGRNKEVIWTRKK